MSINIVVIIQQLPGVVVSYFSHLSVTLFTRLNEIKRQIKFTPGKVR